MNPYDSVLILNTIILKTLDAKIIHTCTYILHVFNDGPVTLDVPVSISAFLECADENEWYQYVFEDDYNNKIQISAHQTATARFIFNKNPGIRSVKVSVYALIPERFKVASGKTNVEVHEYIPGSLEITGVAIDKDGQRYIAAGMNANLTLDIHYPQRVINDAEFSYSWTVGKSRYTSLHPYLIHRFTSPGPQWVRVAVVAHIPSYGDSNFTRFKWGYFDVQVIVKYPFTNINITGNTYLQHGQLLNLDVFCSGSGPVDYCWKILPPTESFTNLSCSKTVTAVECSFPIIYYFRYPGDYLLAISIDNVVSSRQRNIEIHIYDVSLRPQLSTIIIPMVCTILVVLIVAGAVLAHVRQKTNYDVETANFDFMVVDETGTVTTETSWEYMRRSFVRLLRIPYIYYTTQIQNVNYGTIVKHGQSN